MKNILLVVFWGTLLFGASFYKVDNHCERVFFADRRHPFETQESNFVKSLRIPQKCVFNNVMLLPNPLQELNILNEEDVIEIYNMIKENMQNLDITKERLNRRIKVNVAQYITSFDFYTGNELVHLVKLENGLFALAPNHKINWKGESELADYKKNKTIWKIDK